MRVQLRTELSSVMLGAGTEAQRDGKMDAVCPALLVFLGRAERSSGLPQDQP